MAGLFNMSADQGATYLLTVTWYLPGTTPTPIDLTGYSAHMQVRTQAGAPDPPVLDLNTADGTILLGGTAGTVTINIPSSMMQPIQAGSYRYDLNLISGDTVPVVTKLIAGSFKVTAAVTDP
jgi:hypothetical protein